MSLPRALILATCLLGAAACGGEHDPPSAPSAPRRLTGLTVVPAMPIGVGESEQLRAFFQYSDGSIEPPPDVAWTTSQEAVCALWPGGIVVGVAPGSVTVTARAGDYTATAPITVEARASGTRHVEGRVIDYRSGAGLGGVAVGFGRSNLAVDTQAMSDAAGHFAIDLAPGDNVAFLDGVLAGTIKVRVGGPGFRGDLIGGGGTCMTRYGVVTDAQTFQPVAGATVHLGGSTIVTGADGWWRLDFFCPDDPDAATGGSVFMSVSHPSYREFAGIIGRGLRGVRRLDLELQRP
jgi:hypothetical protein